MAMPFEKELAVARRVARESGELAMRLQAQGVEAEEKADLSPVTIADKECEKLISRLLLEAFPDDGLLGEEGANRESANGRKWIIDPIDGTRDFVRGTPVWSVLIGLEVDGVVETGVCHLAPRGGPSQDRFRASEDVVRRILVAENRLEVVPPVAAVDRDLVAIPNSDIGRLYCRSL